MEQQKTLANQAFYHFVSKPKKSNIRFLNLWSRLYIYLCKLCTILQFCCGHTVIYDEKNQKKNQMKSIKYRVL
jgi:hypothetical protein